MALDPIASYIQALDLDLESIVPKQHEKLNNLFEQFKTQTLANIHTAYGEDKEEKDSAHKYLSSPIPAEARSSSDIHAAYSEDKEEKNSAYKYFNSTSPVDVRTPSIRGLLTTVGGSSSGVGLAPLRSPNSCLFSPAINSPYLRVYTPSPSPAALKTFGCENLELQQKVVALDNFSKLPPLVTREKCYFHLLLALIHFASENQNIQEQVSELVDKVINDLAGEYAAYNHLIHLRTVVFYRCGDENLLDEFYKMREKEDSFDKFIIRVQEVAHYHLLQLLKPFADKITSSEKVSSLNLGQLAENFAEVLAKKDIIISSPCDETFKEVYDATKNSEPVEVAVGIRSLGF